MILSLFGDILLYLIFSLLRRLTHALFFKFHFIIFIRILQDLPDLVMKSLDKVLFINGALFALTMFSFIGAYLLSSSITVNSNISGVLFMSNCLNCLESSV